MRIDGTVVPVSRGVRFTREAWCQLVLSRPEFRRIPGREVHIPYAGATFRGPPDTSEVLMEGRPIGVVYWSMVVEPLVHISIEPRGLPLVSEWATALGGAFRPEPTYLHFGYFDHTALAHGQIVGRSDPRIGELMAIRQELFDSGFFEVDGALTCFAFRNGRLAVDRILALVDQSGCDVVYNNLHEFNLLPRPELPILLALNEFI